MLIYLSVDSQTLLQASTDELSKTYDNKSILASTCSIQNVNLGIFYRNSWVRRNKYPQNAQFDPMEVIDEAVDMKLDLQPLLTFVSPSISRKNLNEETGANSI